MTVIINPIITTDSNTGGITLSANTTEMLRVAKDGFYVRGVKIPQDEKEALTVYNTFNQWLMWAALTRDY